MYKQRKDYSSDQIKDIIRKNWEGAKKAGETKVETVISCLSFIPTERLFANREHICKALRELSEESKETRLFSYRTYKETSKALFSGMSDDNKSVMSVNGGGLGDDDDGVSAHGNVTDVPAAKTQSDAAVSRSRVKFRTVTEEEALMIDSSGDCDVEFLNLFSGSHSIGASGVTIQLSLKWLFADNGHSNSKEIFKKKAISCLLFFVKPTNWMLHGTVGPKGSRVRKAGWSELDKKLLKYLPLHEAGSEGYKAVQSSRRVEIKIGGDTVTTKLDEFSYINKTMIKNVALLSMENKDCSDLRSLSYFEAEYGKTGNVGYSEMTDATIKTRCTSDLSIEVMTNQRDYWKKMKPFWDTREIRDRFKKKKGRK